MTAGDHNAAPCGSPAPVAWLGRTMGSPDGTHTTMQRASSVLLLVARLLVLYLALQVSGAGPALWGDCCSTDDDDCSGQTERERPCNDCPPGCPKCHCSPTPFSAPLPTETARLVPDPRERPVVWTPYEAEAPREAPLSSIFRPPKLA